MSSPRRLKIRLYVAGDAPNSVAALTNLRKALALLPDDGVDVEIVDVVTNPARGLDDGVLVTPMLVKHEPPPERRVLGSLRDTQILLRALGIDGQAS